MFEQILYDMKGMCGLGALDVLAKKILSDIRRVGGTRAHLENLCRGSATRYTNNLFSFLARCFAFLLKTL